MLFAVAFLLINILSWSIAAVVGDICLQCFDTVVWWQEGQLASKSVECWYASDDDQIVAGWAAGQ